MKKKYEAFTFIGSKVIRTDMYANNPKEIIQAVLKMVDYLKEYTDVKKQVIVKHNGEQILNFTW